MTKNELITQIKISLQDSDVSKVILFGSYAKGTQSNDSDVDLLIVTNDNFLPESFAKKWKSSLKSLQHFIQLENMQILI